MHYSLTQFSLIPVYTILCLSYWCTLCLVLHWTMQCPSACWCGWHSVIGWLVYKMHVVRQLTTNNIMLERGYRYIACRSANVLCELMHAPTEEPRTSILHLKYLLKPTERSAFLGIRSKRHSSFPSQPPPVLPCPQKVSNN